MADLREQLQNGLADRYRLERELGRGGMATVFLAQDLRHDRPVALKVLHPDLAQALGPERFQREIKLAARLQHPHILTVHDSGETAGHLWFTMPYVEGESLRDRLRRETQLPVEVALRIATDAARALEYAHEHGIIHRDIKPENLLLTKDGSTLVADFGIARALSEGGEQLTQTGMSVGTPAYMSPEQAAGDRHLDARTDVYSLGTVLYEMLAGEPPFTGPTAQAIIAKRFSGEVPQVRRVRPSVPESVDHAVSRALAPVAADRFASAAEFARALQPTAATPSITPTVPLAPAMVGGSRGSATPNGRVRRRMPVAAAALGLGVLIGVGVLFAWRRSQSVADKAGGTKLLAVLPFENLGDSADDYFADGVTDAVRGKLAALPRLRVTARNSSSQYRKTTKTPQQIGEELDVQYLLTATVRWQKGGGGTSRVQVTPELVLVASGSTRWQQPFASALTDVFEVQAEIAARVAQALNVALGDSAHEQLAEAPTNNLAAYDAFLRGEAASQGMSVTDPPSLRRAVAAYQQAVALDSTFVEAWAQLARTQAILYYLSTPTPGLAEAARAAATRALTLAPTRPEGHRAMSAYYANVLVDINRALAEDSTALLLGPLDADLLVAVARKEVAFGRWDTALAHLKQASRLDPRSALTAARLGSALLWLRRYPEALQACDRALALAPTNLASFGQKVTVFLAQGDLAGAREVLAVAAKEVDASRLVASFADDGLAWVLDDAEHALLFGLSPSAFDDDRGTWGIVLAEAHWLRGDQPKARVYADSARIALEKQIQVVPNDANLRGSLGLALAYLGRKVAAIREGERSVALLPARKDAIQGAALQDQLVQIYILVGEPEKALDHLEPLLKIPNYLSRAWLRIDPTFAALRGNPRFERLVNGT